MLSSMDHLMANYRSQGAEGAVGYRDDAKRSNELRQQANAAFNQLMGRYGIRTAELS